MDARGEITDADRRIAAERSGLPEATVYGVSTFYDDLLAPRGRRHVRVCTGTACYAATGDAHVDEIRDGLGLALGERSADGAVSLAETVCLGFCHSVAGRPRRRGHRRGPRRRRARAGAHDRRRPGAGPGQRPRRAGAHPPRRLLGPAQGAGDPVARGAARGGQEGQRARPWRRRLPGRAEVELHARRGGRARSSSSPTATRATRGPTSTRSSWRATRSCCIEGLALAGLRGRRRARLRPRALRVPALQARARRRRSPARTSRACSATTSSAAGSPST